MGILYMHCKRIFVEYIDVLNNFLVTDIYCTFYKSLYLGEKNVFLFKCFCQNI